MKTDQDRTSQPEATVQQYPGIMNAIIVEQPDSTRVFKLKNRTFEHIHNILNGYESKRPSFIKAQRTLATSTMFLTIYTESKNKTDRLETMVFGIEIPWVEIEFIADLPRDYHLCHVPKRNDMRCSNGLIARPNYNVAEPFSIPKPAEELENIDIIKED